MDRSALSPRLRSLLGASAGAFAAGGTGLAVHSLTGSAALALLPLLLGSALVGWWADARARSDLVLAGRLALVTQRMARGERIAAVELDDLGRLRAVGEQVNAVIATVSEVSRRVLDVVARVSGLPQQITEAVAEIEGSSEAQEEAVEETASLLMNINASIRDINERVDKLSRYADESASSILQMGSSVDEVARNAASLHESADATTSTVHEMGASIRQVAEGAENVQRMAEETAASMLEMDRTVQQVSEHVRQASSLTEQVAEGAHRGSEAVDATIRDIESIRALTLEATSVLERLVARIGEIGNTLSVIGEINDETNLLSLNAAIIAAQAGEQGRAFLVVANHVKTLAQRTASSTEEIERVIRAVQEESQNAVRAMSAGAEAIEQGVQRSQVAGRALDAIRDSAADSSARVAEIARASDEQSRSSKLVARAAQETSQEVQQISTALAEQSRASEQLLKNSEAALDLCRHVHRSTDEQRDTGRYITDAISKITEMIRGIQESTSRHALASHQVSDAVNTLLANAQKSGRQIPEVNGMVQHLRVNAEEILDALSRFGGEASQAESPTSSPESAAAMPAR